MHVQVMTAASCCYTAVPYQLLQAKKDYIPPSTDQTALMQTFFTGKCRQVALLSDSTLVSEPLKTTGFVLATGKEP